MVSSSVLDYLSDDENRGGPNKRECDCDWSGILKLKGSNCLLAGNTKYGSLPFAQQYTIFVAHETALLDDSIVFWESRETWDYQRTWLNLASW